MRLIEPAVHGIFLAPNMLNLTLEPSYVERVRRQHAASPVRAPACHLIFGLWDGLVTPRPASGLRATFPTAEASVVRRGLHQLNVLNPATVCACVEGFERRRRGTSTALASAQRRPVRVLGWLLLRRVLGWLDWTCGVVAEPMAGF